MKATDTPTGGNLPLITFSIVVYRQPLEELRAAVNSLLHYKGRKIIYIEDNSPTDDARSLAQLSPCVRYNRQPRNVGCGKANNAAIRKAMAEGSAIHFAVNPDIAFSGDVVTPMAEYMLEHPEVGGMMPKVLSPDGTVQHLPKLTPSPLMLLQRRTGKIAPRLHERWMRKFEMHGMRDNRVYEIGHVSGCFAALRVEALRECGLFDERFFMYFEDADLSRRIHRHYKTLYFPFVSVRHSYGHGASKHGRLFCIFVASLIKYFNKWGWFFDRARRESNRTFLAQLKS